ncbi:hypothetical protein KIN20_018736 [Parelaphostrongylus tenuis]|uniref:Uncharacterized protein n=1 Tax=Parelaphostrongylus tenuis TaxID=148309 RepID=A0AAD5MJV3_PARTN|nr:hypothetical protein KIN20_018736 [Parelaphostrongylus tenuis]
MGVTSRKSDKIFVFSMLSTVDFHLNSEDRIGRKNWENYERDEAERKNAMKPEQLHNVKTNYCLAIYKVHEEERRHQFVLHH